MYLYASSSYLLTSWHIIKKKVFWDDGFIFFSAFLQARVQSSSSEDLLARHSGQLWVNSLHAVQLQFWLLLLCKEHQRAHAYYIFWIFLCLFDCPILSASRLTQQETEGRLTIQLVPRAFLCLAVFVPRPYCPRHSPYFLSKNWISPFSVRLGQWQDASKVEFPPHSPGRNTFGVQGVRS